MRYLCRLPFDDKLHDDKSMLVNEFCLGKLKADERKSALTCRRHKEPKRARTRHLRKGAMVPSALRATKMRGLWTQSALWPPPLR